MKGQLSTQAQKSLTIGILNWGSSHEIELKDLEFNVKFCKLEKERGESKAGGIAEIVMER